MRTYKEINPELKIVIAIGGWNFPSAYFSEMASTPEYRAAWIKKAKKFIDQYDLDGIDLDWEFPCSSPRKSDLIEYCTV